VAADLGFGHAPTHGLRHACTVGHEDAPVRGRHHPAHDGDVLVVERARVEADPDLAPAGGCRGRAWRPVPAGRARRAGAVRYPSSSTAIRQRTTAEHRARRRRPGQARHLPGTRGRLRRRGRVPQLQPRAFPGARRFGARRARGLWRGSGQRRGRAAGEQRQRGRSGRQTAGGDPGRFDRPSGRRRLPTRSPRDSGGDLPRSTATSARLCSYKPWRPASRPRSSSCSAMANEPLLPR
jgi:hypothetical protein